MALSNYSIVLALLICTQLGNGQPVTDQIIPESAELDESIKINHVVDDKNKYLVDLNSLILDVSDFLNAFQRQKLMDEMERRGVEMEDLESTSEEKRASSGSRRRHHSSRWDVGFGKRAAVASQGSFLDSIFKLSKNKYNIARRQRWDVSYGK